MSANTVEPQQPSEGPPNREAKAKAKAAKAYSKAMRPWHEKKQKKREKQKKQRRVAGLLLIIIMIPAAVGAAISEKSKPTASENPSQAVHSEKPAAEKSAAREKPAAEMPAAEKKPEMTSGQKYALHAGQMYVDTLPFSKAGLIQQLSSSAGEGYSRAEATFAANHVDADWNAEAVEAARNYLDTMPFSKADLIQQLSSAAGGDFTPAQARYAVSKVY